MNSLSHKHFLVLLAIMLSAGCGSADDLSTGAADTRTQALRDKSTAFASLSIEQMLSDTSAQEIGGQLFGARCAVCHGAEGIGKLGVMNLVNGSYNYGESLEAIRATISEGRQSTMPGMGNKLGEMLLGQLVAYVESLAFEEPPTRFAQRGSEQFTENCATCHGADGQGNPELGAPDLTDDYWLHGDETMTLRLVITRGAQSECPAQADDLTGVEMDLLTAHVARLHGDDF